MKPINNSTYMDTNLKSRLESIERKLVMLQAENEQLKALLTRSETRGQIMYDDLDIICQHFKLRDHPKRKLYR